MFYDYGNNNIDLVIGGTRFDNIYWEYISERGCDGDNDKRMILRTLGLSHLSARSAAQ